MDAYLLAQTIAQKAPPGWVLRQGETVSVASDYTVTIKVAGSTTEVSGVRYLGPTPPLPGAGVWLLANGSDVIALGSLADTGRTLSPRVYRTSDVNITDGTDTTVTWQADEFDALGHWSSGSSVTVKVPGRYLIVAQVRFAANATGHRDAWIMVDQSAPPTPAGRSVARTQVPATSGSPTYFQVVSQPVALGTNDTVELRVRQNSGGTLALIGGAYDTALALTYLGP